MLELDVLKKIDTVVDSDEFLKLAEDIASLAGNSGIGNTQVRNLQNIVNSTTRFSEIVNFVKAQTGRHRETWGKLGPAIIEALAKIDASTQNIDSGEKKGEIRLRLCRHWVKIVVADYLYSEVCTRRG